MSKTILATIVGLTLFVSNVHGQRFTTVQLPTFRTFSMSTTIVVPDRGRVHAGGVNRSHRSSSRRGTPLLPSTSHAYGNGTSAGGVSVSAHIHDMQELDRARLAEWDQIKATRRRNTSDTVALSKPTAVQTARNHRLPRVSDVRRQVEAERLQARKPRDRRSR